MGAHIAHRLAGSGVSCGSAEGAQGRADGRPRDPTLAEKERIARRYIGMHDQLRADVGRRYLGGYFWWYYATDAVPWDRPRSLWPTIEDVYGDIR